MKIIRDLRCSVGIHNWYYELGQYRRITGQLVPCSIRWCINCDESQQEYRNWDNKFFWWQSETMWMSRPAYTPEGCLHVSDGEKL